MGNGNAEELTDFNLDPLYFHRCLDHKTVADARDHH